MKILIAGGTGYVGQKLGPDLVKAGHDLTVLTRRSAKAQEDMSYPAQFVSWRELESRLGKGDLNFDAVINLAGEGIADRRWSRLRKTQLRDSRVNVTLDLVRIIGIQAKRPHVWIQASAIGIYGDRGDEWLLEDGGLGRGFLAELCREWEASLDEAAAIRSVIFRIGVVVGPGSGFLRALEPVWKKGMGGVLGSGRQWLSWIHIDDLVQVLIRSLDDQSFSGVFNVVSPEPLRNREMTRVLSRKLKVPALIPAPSLVLRLVLGEMASAILGSQRVSAHKLIHLNFSFQYATFQEALNAIYGDTSLSSRA